MALRPEALDALLSYWLGSMANEHVDDIGSLDMLSHDLAWKLMQVGDNFYDRNGAPLLFAIAYPLALRSACAVIEHPLQDPTGAIRIALDNATLALKSYSLEAHAPPSTFAEARRSLGQA